MDETQQLSKGFLFKLYEHGPSVPPLLHDNIILQLVEVKFDITQYTQNPNKSCLPVQVSDGVYQTKVQLVNDAKKKLDENILNKYDIMNCRLLVHKKSIILIVDYNVIRDDIQRLIGDPRYINEDPRSLAERNIDVTLPPKQTNQSIILKNITAGHQNIPKQPIRKPVEEKIEESQGIEGMFDDIA